MLVTAELDLSESGRVRRPEKVNVLIHMDSHRDPAKSLGEALAAIDRCRLIRDGHVYTTKIQHSVSPLAAAGAYSYRMGEDGEVWSESPGDAT